MRKYILMTVLSTFSFICHAQQYEVGTTTAIWKNPVAADFKKAKEQGVHYVEVAFNQCYRGVPTEEVIPRIKMMKSKIDSAGMQVWSVHLPFSRVLDISVLDDSLREENVRFMARMIEQCRHFKPARLVLHPSSEPIADSIRAQRIKNARRSIIYLKPYADRIGAQLCIENLPRTCLGNTPEELLKLIHDIPGVKVCFDTNHYTKGSTRHFMEVLGQYVGTIHASDFDLVNECHWLPTQGKIDWQNFMRDLRSNGYQGVFMYEAMKDCDYNKIRPVPSRIRETFEKIISGVQ